MSEKPQIDRLVAGTARTLLSVAPSLPTLAMVEDVMASTRAAVERGYFLPDEDEAVRAIFSTYLTTRAALLSTLEDLRPHALEELSQAHPKRPEIFVVAYCAACLLMRSGRFMIETFRGERLIWKKLDEAEPRFGIPNKQFTKIYRSLTSPAHVWVFLEASRYWRKIKQVCFSNWPTMRSSNRSLSYWSQRNHGFKPAKSIMQRINLNIGCIHFCAATIQGSKASRLQSSRSPGV